MSDTSKAVFLSYASQDADAVRKICDALRAAGVEVWFDQNELVGGDAWDQKIRRQIKECALFVPVISAATQARREGYFRIEWKLAAQRTHAIADGVPFLLPIVIDATRDRDALVPEEFRVVQWTRMVRGETAPALSARVKTLLSGDLSGNGSRQDFVAEQTTGETPAHSASKSSAAYWLVPSMVLVAALAASAIWPWRGRNSNKAASGPPPALTPTVTKVSVAPVSKARELAERAKAMTTGKYNSTADDFQAAEGLLKSALELDANDAEIWAISSEFNTSIRTRGFDDSPARRELARSQAERALKLDANSISGLYALARWQRDNDPDPTVAEKTFLEVLKRDPDHPGALFSLANHYARRNRFEEALALFERAARRPDALALVRYGEYLLYFSRAQFADAERCLRESIAIEPSANSVTALAMVLLTDKGDVAGAVQALNDLPAASRSEHRAAWMSAYIHLTARDPEGALAALRRLSADFIQDNWYIGPTAYWTGRAHLEAGRTEAARTAFEAGLAVMEAKLKADQENGAYHLARGELLAWLGRTDEALREARTADELARPTERGLWFVSTVRIYAALGQPDEAVPRLKSLLNSTVWPLTPALLRIDPQWDKLRSDPRFQALAAGTEKKSAASNSTTRNSKTSATIGSSSPE